jgi:drug/metabolite transporter (DMT)-like permease
MDGAPHGPRTSGLRVAALTLLSMVAFAGNSLLCRLALQHSAIDAASFTSVRLVAGAAVLALVLRARPGTRRSGDWRGASALFVYAAAFSWAYASLPAATGALLLFGTVQVTMIGHGLWRGERLNPRQVAGLVAACGGLAAMLSPGAHAASWQGAGLMLCAGIAWGVYSLRGRGAADPLGMTAGNFLRASVLALALSALAWRSASVDVPGLLYAVASGALASGLGYVVWYTALRDLTATRAATVQLSVPVIAALGAVVMLDEPVTLRLALTSAVILGGVALVIVDRRPR